MSPLRIMGPPMNNNGGGQEIALASSESSSLSRQEQGAATPDHGLEGGSQGYTSNESSCSEVKGGLLGAPPAMGSSARVGSPRQKGTVERAHHFAPLCTGERPRSDHDPGRRWGSRGGERTRWRQTIGRLWMNVPSCLSPSRSSGRP